MLAEAGGALYAAVLDDGDVIMTSFETDDRTSTVVRHERAHRAWNSVDTRIEAVVSNAGDFSIWVSDDIVVRGADGGAIGRRIARPADLVSFDLSENGEIVVLQRPHGILDVYRSSGEFVGSTEPEALMGFEASVSLLADGSRISAWPVNEIVRWGWAVWNTNPFRREHSGVSAWGRGPGGPSLLANPVMDGTTMYNTYPPTSGVGGALGKLVPLDPMTLEPLGGVPIAHDGRVTNLASSDELGLTAVISFNEDAASDEIIGSVRVSDTASGEQLGREIAIRTGMTLAEITASRARWDIKFDSAGRLVTQLADRVSVWNYDAATWADVACRVAGRNLNRNEWDRFGPPIEYRKTCPQYPIES